MIEEEFDAAQQVLQTFHAIGSTGAFAVEPAAESPERSPYVLMQCANRTNGPSQGSTRRLLEHFRPEVIILVGIAGGIQRLVTDNDGTMHWRGDALPGDVVVGEYVHYADFTKNEDGLEKLRFFAIDHPSEILIEKYFNAVRTTDKLGSPWHAGLPERPKAPSTTTSTASEGRPTEPAQANQPSLVRGEVIAVEGLAGDPEADHQKKLINRPHRRDRVVGAAQLLVDVDKFVPQLRLVPPVGGNRGGRLAWAPINLVPSWSMKWAERPNGRRVQESVGQVIDLALDSASWYGRAPRLRPSGRYGAP